MLDLLWALLVITVILGAPSMLTYRIARKKGLRASVWGGIAFGIAFGLFLLGIPLGGWLVVAAVWLLPTTDDIHPDL